MYKNEDDFVRGQKIKIGVAIVLFATAIAAHYYNTGALGLP